MGTGASMIMLVICLGTFFYHAQVDDSVHIALDVLVVVVGLLLLRCLQEMVYPACFHLALELMVMDMWNPYPLQGKMAVSVRTSTIVAQR